MFYSWLRFWNAASRCRTIFPIKQKFLFFNLCTEGWGTGIAASQCGTIFPAPPVWWPDSRRSPIRARAHTHTHMHRTCVCMCVCVCVHIYIYTYTHTVGTQHIQKKTSLPQMAHRKCSKALISNCRLRSQTRSFRYLYKNVFFYLFFISFYLLSWMFVYVNIHVPR